MWPSIAERLRIPVTFSTYLCEAAFSRMKYLKNKYQTRLVDSNLELGIRLMVSSKSPDFASLSANMQEQGSH
ncbi:hypothetical protein J437_LFUL013897 [Ladona fulva]|uniref:HAT C-terminal dimerisation domain-containing protein n=1 Tax=Ladona fulva TaxID=123851 RepID=A0A8K0PDU5_LADFU|nr:hypothetical protein J437_LFUL013897 [Ladona fulva]